MSFYIVFRSILAPSRRTLRRSLELSQNRKPIVQLFDQSIDYVQSLEMSSKLLLRRTARKQSRFLCLRLLSNSQLVQPIPTTFEDPDTPMEIDPSTLLATLYTFPLAARTVALGPLAETQ